MDTLKMLCEWALINETYSYDQAFAVEEGGSVV